ncbi:MAG: histidine phosphatase family protein [Ruminococcus sp.]|nr:histidine phosphatase family protein [Ruminococcus sp.]CDE30075.1 fructose-2 6-bisphosphatase [Ruminococcus sp. CAG:403]
MKGYRISVIRHGRTAANDSGIYIGRTDFPLSDKGAAELSQKQDTYIYPRVARVYSSPLQRCLETAEILFPDVPIQTVDNLIEMDFGTFEGKSTEELIDRPEFKTWIKGGLECRPPEGESVQEVQLRIFKALREIIQDMMTEDLLHCAVITHSGIISNMLAGFGLPKIDAKELLCEPGEGFDILVTAQLWQRSQAFEILGKTPYSE